MQLIKKNRLESIIDTTLPAFRDDEARIDGIMQAVYDDDINGMKVYIENLDVGVQEEARTALRGYASALYTHYYKKAVRASEINDTLDKLTTPIEAGLDLTGVGHLPAWFLRAVQVIGPASALYMQWDSMNRSRGHLAASYGEQKKYFFKSAVVLGAIELSELIPAVGAFIGPGTDLFNLYVKNANGLIARGITPGSFEAYLAKFEPGLYAKLHPLI